MLFGKLLPKEGNFFELFNQHAERIVEAAHVGNEHQQAAQRHRPVEDLPASGIDDDQVIDDQGRRAEAPHRRLTLSDFTQVDLPKKLSRGGIQSL